MYAVIKTGGKQYRVSEGDKLRVEKLPGDAGATVTFDEVLMIGGEKVAIGKPLVKGAKVTGKVVGETKGEKVIAFRFKRRKNVRKKRGHRQHYTRIQITGIQA